MKEFLRTAFAMGIAAPPMEVTDDGNSEYDNERRGLCLAFSGKTWWDVEYGILSQQRDSIPLFNTDGFTYYMPAFLLGCLEFERPEAHDMCACVMINLNPMLEGGGTNKHVYEKLTKFTESQHRAVAKFVALFLGLEGLIGSEARSAFNFYWKEYATSANT